MRHNTRLSRIVITAFVLVAAIGAGFAGTAAAHHEPNEGDGYNPIDDFLHGDNGEAAENDSDSWTDRVASNVPSWMSATIAGIGGAKDRALVGLSDMNPWAKEPPTNAENANAFIEAVNDHAATYEAEINARSAPSSEYDVHEIRFVDENSENVTVYVLGEINSTSTSSSIENIRALNASEFDEQTMNRGVDEHWAVDGYAAEDLDNLANEIATRIQDDQPLNTAYQAKLAGRYCSLGNPLQDSLANPENCDIRSTLWMDKEDL